MKKLYVLATFSFLLVSVLCHSKSLNFDGIDDHAKIPHDPIFELNNGTSVQTATISITNNDCDELDFSFAVQAEHGTSTTNQAALSFDGIDDIVSVTHNSTLDLGTGSFTLEAWVKTSGTDEIFVGKSQNGGGPSAQIMIENNGFPRLFIRGGGSLNLEGASVINDGAWHHIAGVRDGDTANLYIDGVLVDSNTGVSSYNVNNTNPLAIGGIISGGSASQLSSGSIDEVRVWNTARSVSEIMSGMNTELSNPSAEPNLLAYYNFNEGIPNADNTGIIGSEEVQDLSGNGYHGDMQSFNKNGNGSNWVDSVPVLSLEDLITETIDFVLYPNPARQRVRIDYKATAELSKVTVYNMLGKKIFSTLKESFSVQRLDTGLYFVTIETNKGTSTKKLIVN